MFLMPKCSRFRRTRIATVVLGALLTAVGRSATASAYLTYRYDNARTGTNPTETVLNTGNVNTSSFGKLWSRAVDGQVYAQPLYLPGVAIAGRGTHNVVFAATEHNTVYAFDADSNAPPNDVPLWSKNLGRSVPESVVGCADIDGPEYGITGTPAIDAGTHTIYVVAKTLDGGVQNVRLHALDVRSGAERPGWPVLIGGSVAGNGGGSRGGRIAFSPFLQGQRPGVLLLDGRVWIAFASHCDNSIASYHGWIFGYSASNPSEAPLIYCTSPDPEADSPGAGGIWQSGQGPAADADGNLYFITGNGGLNVDLGGRNVGDAIVKLRPHGDSAPYQLTVTRLVQSMRLSNAALGAQPQWRVLAPGAAKSGTLQAHLSDYARPAYNDAGTDPYTGGSWHPFPYAPGDAGPAGRANQPGGIPDNSSFVLRLHFTVPSGFSATPPGARFYLGGFNVDDNNLGTFFNGVNIGSGTGSNTIYKFEIPRSAVQFGRDNVIAIVGYEGPGAAGFTLGAPQLTIETASTVQMPAGGLFNGNPDDYFAPSNALALDAGDTDLGSGGATVLPDQSGTSTPRLVVGCGKDGIIRLVNRDHMGGFAGRSNPQAPDRAVQDYCCIGGEWGSPAYWEGPGGHFLYFVGSGDVIHQFRLLAAGGRSVLSPIHVGRITYPFPGPTPTISSNGGAAGTGVLWTLDRGANALRANDAEDVSRLLYDSNAAANRRDAIGRVIKFSVPTPVDGKVFVGATNHLLAFGLLNPTPAVPVARIRVADVSGAPGSAIDVPIVADASANNVAGVLLTFQYGQALSIADPSDVILGALIPGADALTAVNLQPGYAIIAATGTGRQDGPGTLLTIHATIPSIPPGRYPLTLASVTLNDPAGNTIPSAVDAGTLTVLAERPGDADGDGQVTLGDVVIALRIAVGIQAPTPQQLAALDLDHNGQVDIGDVTRILAYVVGVIPSL